MRKTLIAIIYNLVEDDKEGYYKDVNSVEDALETLEYDVSKIPVRHPSLAGVEEVLTKIKQLSPICIFNLCEGVNGNSWGEVYIAGLLELLRIPYTGTGPLGLALSLDKAKSKDILRSNGINVPQYQVFSKEEQGRNEKLKFPLIVKPLHEDGSCGIDCDSVVYDEKTLCIKINEIHEKFREPGIVEEYIDGRELNVSILGNNKAMRVIPISEIDYSNMPIGYPRICSYKAKWRTRSIEYKNTVPVCPADISNQLKGEIEDIAVRVYEIMGCRDYARIDIRLDKNEIPYIIDVNPNPCLSQDSGFVRSAGKAGLDYVDLIGEIVNICMERNGARRNEDTQVTARR